MTLQTPISGTAFGPIAVKIIVNPTVSGSNGGAFDFHIDCDEDGLLDPLKAFESLPVLPDNGNWQILDTMPSSVTQMIRETAGVRADSLLHDPSDVPLLPIPRGEVRDLMQIFADNGYGQRVSTTSEKDD